MPRPIDPPQLLIDLLGLDPLSHAALSDRLDAIGGLHALSSSGSEALDSLLSPSAAAHLDRILSLAVELISPRSLPSPIDSASSVAAYFRPRLSVRSSESFWVLMLDARGRPIAHACIAEGTLTACLVHPREVFAPALRARAASIIVVHNHPSGDPEPSDEDEELTARLVEAGHLLGIPLLDHVIVARGGFRSLGGAHGVPCSDSGQHDPPGKRRARTWKARSRRATMQR